MIIEMAMFHISEAEAARDFLAVLARVRDGAEVVIEAGHRRIALIKPIEGPGRPLDDCIAVLRRQGSTVTLDDDFAGDLEQIIAERKPLDTSAWE
jgi:antitoxin (DNA-binding transcriptional repressor) of toxin-antitoxin stability system